MLDLDHLQFEQAVALLVSTQVSTDPDFSARCREAFEGGLTVDEASDLLENRV